MFCINWTGKSYSDKPMFHLFSSTNLLVTWRFHKYVLVAPWTRYWQWLIFFYILCPPGTPKVLFNHETVRVGDISERITILVPVYSYPNLTNWTLTHDGQNITDDGNHSISKTSGEVYTTFYGVNVTLIGWIINFTIANLQESDFGLYTLRLLNGIGETVQNFNITAKCMYMIYFAVKTLRHAIIMY